MTTQVTGKRLTATGFVIAQPSRLRAIHFVGAAAAGTIVLKTTPDLGSGTGGTNILTIDTPASTAFSEYMKLPGLGVKFDQSMYATLTNVTAATFFFG